MSEDGIEGLRWLNATGRLDELAREMAPLIGKEISTAIVTHNAALRSELAELKKTPLPDYQRMVKELRAELSRANEKAGELGRENAALKASHDKYYAKLVESCRENQKRADLAEAALARLKPDAKKLIDDLIRHQQELEILTRKWTDAEKELAAEKEARAKAETIANDADEYRPLYEKAEARIAELQKQLGWTTGMVSDLRCPSCDGKFKDIRCDFCSSWMKEGK